ncbi:hypothetical protein DM860_000579 [Cuscuta australis]|nr:hypothetical protein DM860_000579 [Cuscuta australis]
MLPKDVERNIRNAADKCVLLQRVDDADKLLKDFYTLVLDIKIEWTKKISQQPTSDLYKVLTYGSRQGGGKVVLKYLSWLSQAIFCHNTLKHYNNHGVTRKLKDEIELLIQTELPLVYCQTISLLYFYALASNWDEVQKKRVLEELFTCFD